jgi:pSer/pThr/pTyr-binding forkhead associated (FHA) protein
MPPTDPATLTDRFATACRAAGPLEVRAVHRPTGAGQAFTVAPPFAFLGRAPVMTVRLDDPSVSQCHAYLQVVNGAAYLADLGSRTGALWDDGSDGAGWVRPGRPVRLGAFDVWVEVPGRADPEAVPADRLPAVAAEVCGPAAEAPDFHLLDRPVTLVGRHPGCHLRLLDEAAAYFHTALVNTPDGVWAVDLLTRRGTLVNGRPTRLAALREGDLLEYGRAAVVLRDGLPVARPLAVGGAAVARAADDAALQQRVAETVLVAVAPVRAMMEQFQQVFATMAEVIGRMQREQSGVVCEQMRLLQEVTKELQELRADKGAGGRKPADPATTPPAGAKLPTPKMANPADGQTLKDAHQWFLDRLAQLGQPAAPRRD